MSHCSFGFFSEKQLPFPKAERAVPFECRHETHNSFAVEERHVPLDRFLDIWTAAMHKPAQMFENRPRERLRLLNISVNTRIFLRHDDYSFSRGCCDDVAAV